MGLILLVMLLHRHCSSPVVVSAPAASRRGRNCHCGCTWRCQHSWHAACFRIVSPQVWFISKVLATQACTLHSLQLCHQRVLKLELHDVCWQAGKPEHVRLPAPQMPRYNRC